MLIVFTTLQGLDLVDSSGAAYSREQNRVFKSLFLVIETLNNFKLNDLIFNL